ncbi:TetR/AcrR family transcriptional regulator [Bacillus sp. FJAT-27251]|uniref:TetR/AcrR family transcriptional regulator n=1 Tax=Bacillus sp. FJAT-27251 TaxID=1684142 RepID=UPI0006A7E7E1|nr:TetR/AcrR family transcriptional regulator [Bacillus sp. FJAT-27251]
MQDQDQQQLVGSFPSLPKQERALQKRKALLESGRILFIEKGYEHTTAKEIAAHAMVATGTFYRYFSDKRQLLMALLKDQLDRLVPPEPSWLDKNPEALLSSSLEAHFSRLDKLGLHRVLPELLPHDGELAEVLAEGRKKLHDNIHKGLKQAQNEGLTWNDLDLDSVAWSILFLVERIPEMKLECGKKTSYDEIAKIICRMVFPPEILVQLRSGSRTLLGNENG